MKKNIILNLIESNDRPLGKTEIVSKILGDPKNKFC
jgi:hypothetical protein